MVVSKNIVQDGYDLAVAVLRMRGVEGEPRAYQIYPGTVSVVAEDGRKFHALLAEARQAVAEAAAEGVVEETAVSPVADPVPKGRRRR